MFVQSPLNYTGGKYKLLPQLIKLFPKNINLFIDLFGGGFNVGINVDCPTIIYNEYNTMVYNMIKGICRDDLAESLNFIDNMINNYNLSKGNKQNYLKLRKDFNKNPNKDWRTLYTLVAHSFNNSIRFNKSGEFNVAFGCREFNTSLKNKFIEFSKISKTKNIIFMNKDFLDIISNKSINSECFFYIDPPYLITTANYNENGGWDEKMERILYSQIDNLDTKGCKFALSNVIEHKGKSNDILKEWMKKYNVYYIESNYNNCNYQSKNKDKPTIEVLITNYKEEK